MQQLRTASALSRAAAALGAGSARGSASLAAAGAAAEQAGGAKARFSELRRVLGPFGSGRQEEERAPEGARGLHAGLAALQQGSTFNDPDATAKEAGRPTAGGGSGRDIPAGEGSGGYGLLAAAHAGLAVTCFAAPTALANFYFPGAALPEGFQSQALVKLLGCGVGVGAASAAGLKQLADAGQLGSPTAQRLQLGLMGFSAGNIALHALYLPSITTTALAAGAAVMGATALIPYQHYTRTNGGLKPGEAVRSYLGAVPDHFNVTGLQSGLYSLCTPVLALAGAAYLFAPGYTLAHMFGFVKSVDAFFLWQAIGGGLMTVAPAATYSLKKAADGGRLGEAWAKVLNLGVAAAAAGHLAVLASMWMANQGGPFLPYVVGAWATALMAGGMGLMGGAAKAASKA